MTDSWNYGDWQSGEPYDWMGNRGESEYDAIDFHVDIGCGRVKKGRIGVDRFVDDGVDVVCDLDATYSPDGTTIMHHGPITFPNPHPLAPNGFAAGSYRFGLPFPTGSIESVVSHHCLEHIGKGFVPLVDEIYRVLKPGGLFRAITPLFPSRTAVEDPDHKRYFMEGTWQTFCGFPEEEHHPTPEGNHWMSSFSTPYTKSRFEMLDQTATPLPDDPWGPDGARELRVALRARK